MIDVSASTGRTLRYGVLIGLAILVAGLIAEIIAHDTGISIITAGIAVIIFTPMVSIMVAAASLYLEKDYVWLGWVSILLIITVIGFIVAYLY